MDADLDLLLIAVYCTCDDLLPAKGKNAKRILTDAEVVTLSVAQQVLRISSDEQFWAMAPHRLGHLFPRLPKRPGFVKRRQRLSDKIEALILEFARHTNGFDDDLLVVDSTPVECGRSVETTRRSALGNAAEYGYCASHSRFFWGFRLHGLFATDGTPRALALTSPKTGERDVALDMLARCHRNGPVTVIGDKGYSGRDFHAQASALGATIVRPRRKDEAGKEPHLAPIRQCVESIFWTCKDMLNLEDHRARELHTLRTRLAAKFLALTAAIALNERLGRPPRNLTAYYA
ncbi:IS982 family transposase [Paraconexibacter antarcticus]|uniref:IS982 family transposase n=1 Tax=Paraconexibacter antarcticus TaxID=2949664 RepID=A0ABY5DT31_9ACTN|nr:IS982 family transposase [Paraconexibacter antarcticus]UTI62279.1 IS982 family transposase [Paraconexibacter antarcticus]UTI63130.1 IS982 family transposase [Paraconexibacter antarcticus]UTI63193.1 IS982 family transposase [Paraconexibacter antarcticus]UTI63655.1 IS982 family transposase [Paraconexibacter antarcticus]UTI63717.1 IS982 family transposase [Paraconexibacter antarcticus]